MIPPRHVKARGEGEGAELDRKEEVKENQSRQFEQKGNLPQLAPETESPNPFDSPNTGLLPICISAFSKCYYSGVRVLLQSLAKDV